MKKTLLQMTQSILSDMDSENVNSISDSEEATQVANVIQETFYNIIASRDIPEHDRLVKLTALGDNTKPTHFKYTSNVKEIRLFEYDNREVHYKDPIQFLNDMPTDGDDVISVTDPLSSTTLYVRNNKNPKFYTTFDDEYIICDSYDSTVENTLQESKTRCWGSVVPTFSLVDSYIPDIDEILFPYLLAEAKSTCFSLFKAGSDPKIEQSARRMKSFIERDKHKTRTENARPNYGRR